MRRENDKALQEIDSLLAELRDDGPEMPAHLMERVLEDARAFQPKLKPEQQRQGFLYHLRRASLAWTPMAGLAAASCVGFWIGFYPPEAVIQATGLVDVSVWDDYGTAELSGFGWDMLEDQ